MRAALVSLTLASLCIAPADVLAQTLGVPNEGNRPPAGSPIQIEDCTTGLHGGALIAESNREFKIVFTNEGLGTADLIRFQIDHGDEELAIRDVGKFAPGITVTHVFRRRGGNVYSSPLLAPARLRCSVSAVHFVDGTEWTAAASAANAARGSDTGLPGGGGFLGLRLRSTEAGLVVAFLFPAGAARKAGLEQGDVVRAIDGQHVATFSDAQMLVRATPIGTPLSVDVLRGTQALSITVIVTARSGSVPDSL